MCATKNPLRKLHVARRNLCMISTCQYIDESAIFKKACAKNRSVANNACTLSVDLIAIMFKYKKYTDK